MSEHKEQIVKLVTTIADILLIKCIEALDDSLKDMVDLLNFRSK